MFCGGDFVGDGYFEVFGYYELADEHEEDDEQENDVYDGCHVEGGRVLFVVQDRHRISLVFCVVCCGQFLLLGRQSS